MAIFNSINPVIYREIVDKYYKQIQQSKLPKGFEVDWIDMNDYDGDDESGRLPIKRLKTTTNSEGKEVLEGKYIY